MFRRYIYLSVPFFFSLAPAVSAQDLDPTVEVSRIYQGKMMEVHKPAIEMQIPDSVTHFDLDFDYSVFESPYKGSYEFNPYLLSMKPQPDAWSGRRLFLRAGAGYPLHPVFDLVWAPDFNRKNFNMSVYATHRSYIGGYRNIGAMVNDGRPSMYLNSGGRFAEGSKLIGFNGYDLLTKAGVSGSAGWESGEFTFDVGYYGLATRDTLSSRGYDALDAVFRVRSNDSRDRYFLYDVSLAYRFGEDKLKYLPSSTGGYLGEHLFSIDAVLGPVFSKGQRVEVGVETDIASYSSLFGTYSGRFSVIPQYVLRKGPWSVRAGVRLSCLFNGAGNPDFPAQYRHKGQYAYPDVHVGFDILKEWMNIYLEAGGGEEVGKYSSLLSRAHFITPAYTWSSLPLLDNTVERVSGAVGLRGNISSRFSYDLRAGYRNYANAPLFATVSDAPEAGRFVPTLSYSGYQLFYASLDCGWESEDFSFDGRFTYRSSDIDVSAPVAVSFGYLVPDGDAYLSVFAPAPFSGYVKAMYNWRKRVYAGVDCDFSLSCRSATFSLPSYADLGVYLEFRTARLFSFWVRGGNLLDMTVQRMPMFAESGINFTAGICLNL